MLAGWIKKLQDAFSTPFDNGSNSFDSDNVQQAIEEIDFRELTKEPTGFPNRTDSTISFNDSTRTFTIAPVSSSFSFRSIGKEFVKTTSESVQIDDLEGTWFIYYTTQGVLTTSQTPWSFSDGTVFVAYVYWNVALVKGRLREARHGIVMDWSTHEYLQDVFGIEVDKDTFKLGNYTLTGDGSSNSHAQVSIGNGVLNIYDIKVNVTNSASPSNFWEQRLSTIAYLPMYYRTGTSGWSRLDANTYPIVTDSPNTCKYNKLDTGSWSLVNATSNYAIITWVFATDDVNEPIIGVVGQMQSSNLPLAAKEDIFDNLDLTNFPYPKSKLLYRLIYKTNTDYTNTPKALLGAVDGMLIPNTVPPPSGIRTFPFELHYVSGTGLNTNMSNGAIFRVRPGTFASASYSGYPAAFPLQMPFNCRLFSIVLTFRQASFDYSASVGAILFDIEFRDHYYNGSDVWSRIKVSFGNYGAGNSTGDATHRFELFAGTPGFTYLSGNEVIDYARLIGCRFVKSDSGDRRINSFRDIVMKLNFEEVV